MQRADHTKDHMGLTSWKNAPNGKIVKADVSVAKNYLQQDELQELNEIVTMYIFRSSPIGKQVAGVSVT